MQLTIRAGNDATRIQSDILTGVYCGFPPSKYSPAIQSVLLTEARANDVLAYLSVVLTEAQATNVAAYLTIHTNQPFHGDFTYRTVK
jgi:hypothetical protein